MSFLTEDNDHTGGTLPPVLISALQHYAYCPRQCALIHIEQQFSDNIYTQRGNAVHKLVDTPESVTERGVRIERALPLYSRTYGLIGKADVVEWHDTAPYPVEYKNGPRKARLADEIQLAAQAMCLEEMTGQPVNTGAIYHHKSRRRRVVPITTELRENVVRVANAIRALYDQEKLPPPFNDKRCDDCSLYHLCQPRVIAEHTGIKDVLENLFLIEDEHLI